jgi:hypothetical protein
MELTKEQRDKLIKLRERYFNSLDFSGITNFDNIIFQLLSNKHVEKLMDEMTFSQENIERMLNNKNNIESDLSFQKDEKHYM